MLVSRRATIAPLVRRLGATALPGLALLLAVVAATGHAESRDDEIDGDTITAQVAATERLLDRARHGEAISQMRLGWFVVDLLADLSARDADLSAFVHRDGHFIETYLTDIFQYHSVEEVAAVEAMAAKDRTTPRLAARWGLEALRHIPDSDDPPVEREKDRQALIAALTTLDDLLRALSPNQGEAERRPTPAP